jgi:hypothetical protein
MKVCTSSRQFRVLKKYFLTGERPVNIDNWTYKARNIVLFNHLDEAQLTMAEHIERAKSQEMVINREATRFKNEQQKLPHAVCNFKIYFVDFGILISLVRA